MFEAFDVSEQQNSTHTIVIDSLSFLMEQFESQYVISSTNGMRAWSDYQQYFKTLMQQYIANSNKNILITTHTAGVMNESEQIIETKAVVKGALKGTGVEAYFSCVVSAKKASIKSLKECVSDLLVITEEDELLGYKYVYQTRLTKDTIHEKIRSPLGLFNNKETYMDNDAQKLLTKLHEYYS